MLSIMTVAIIRVIVAVFVVLVAVIALVLSAVLPRVFDQLEDRNHQKLAWGVGVPQLANPLR